ncbi:MAG: histidinol dehydrogenase, partial [Candidatus Eremiobacteraeota bacterium]|nr:histidinol dehydrogenase [Candidatus Eremiobacteraeota bacterium]
MNVIPVSDAGRLAELFRGGWDPPETVVGRVGSIVRDVRLRGDEALVAYTREFDAPDFTDSLLRVSIPSLPEAARLVPDEIARGLELARSRVSRFHAAQLRDDIAYADEDGTEYRFAYRALDSIAAYVPGGTATLPSSVIMAIVPAKVAGVRRAIVLTPPQHDGTVPDAVRFACALCGADELYAVGGAQAIAAAAYGTASVARVDKIVGPGNLWVTEAKRQVYGACAIDGLAGPSEVLIVADDAANVDLVTAELLAQAEHDTLARVVLVSRSETLLHACAQALDALDLSALPRGEILAGVIQHGCYLVHAPSDGDVLDVIDRFAPEHLCLYVRNPQAYLPHVRRAGAIFVGTQTPVAAGDYLAGSNHVLPTSGAARFSSGLSTADFVRTFSVVQNSAARMRADAPTIRLLVAPKSHSNWSADS